MKKKLLILLSFVFAVIFLVFLIYNISYQKKINYVALGDSVAAGQNPYGEKKGYGYTDYLKDYYDSHNRLKSYYNYAVSGYITNDIIDDLKNNINNDQNNKYASIRRVLRESDIVTISIGANDFINTMDLSILNDYEIGLLEDKLVSFMFEYNKKFNELIREIKKYAKGKIFVVGYYNPLPSFKEYNSYLNELISYVDAEYSRMCKDNDITYIKVSHLFNDNLDYLPNPFDIHPSIKGYEAIYKEILKYI